jgi:hypothetical protein
MKLKKYINTDDYLFLTKLINGNVLEHKGLIKSFFDTSKYHGDPELLRDIVNVIDQELIVVGVNPKKMFLFLKAISPFTMTKQDTVYEPDMGWARSSLKVFWNQMIAELIKGKYKDL